MCERNRVRSFDYEIKKSRIETSLIENGYALKLTFHCCSDFILLTREDIEKMIEVLKGWESQVRKWK